MRRIEVKTRVWIQPSPGVNGHWVMNEPIIAKFHQFGSAYEEFESGPGNYSVAIVEMPDGTVQTLALSDIRFLD